MPIDPTNPDQAPPAGEAKPVLTPIPDGPGSTTSATGPGYPAGFPTAQPNDTIIIVPGPGITEITKVGIIGGGKAIDVRPLLTDMTISFSMEEANTITMTCRDPIHVILRNALLGVGLPTDAELDNAIKGAKRGLIVDAPPDQGSGSATSAEGPPVTVTGGSNSTQNFYANVLNNLGAPVSAANLTALYSVAKIEGQNDRYNPMNSVIHEAGSTGFNSVDVQAYASFATGVKGTVDLLNGSPWTAVLAALKGDRGTSAVLAAIKQVYSSWDPSVQFPTTGLDSVAQRSVGPVGPSGGTSPPITNTGPGSATTAEGPGTDPAPAGSAAPTDQLNTKQTASVVYRGEQFDLTTIATDNSGGITLTFEDHYIATLRRNHQEITEKTNITISAFVNFLLAADKIPNKTQQDEVVQRDDPTNILDSGETDPASLDEFDKLIALDHRGTGSTTGGNRFKAVVGGAIEDSWATITDLVNSTLNWRSFATEGASNKVIIGGDLFVLKTLGYPTLSLTEGKNGVEWMAGTFDLTSKTGNQLSFSTNEFFLGLLGQKCTIPNMGLLSGPWMVDSYSYEAFSAKTSVTLKRITAELLEDAFQSKDASIAEAEAAGKAGGTGANAGGGTGDPQPGDKGSTAGLTGPRAAAVAKVIAFAIAQIGKPYDSPGNSVTTFDCSGLVQAAWAQVGVSMPHNAAAQMSSMKLVSRADIQPGDLVFMEGNPPGHVALYIGNGKLVEASDYGIPLRYNNLGYIPITAIGRPG